MAVKGEFGQQQAGEQANYGKPIQTIGTSSGLQYEKGAFQDSIRVGAALERRIERLQMPSQIAISVSASPHHRAGSLSKDIGIVGVPGGWELYVGGSGERQVVPGQLLCTVVNEDELIELTSAFLQYYRETGRYAEQTAQWIERMGLSCKFREMLFEPIHVRQLINRMELSLASAEEQEQAKLLTNQQRTAAVTR